MRYMRKNGSAYYCVKSVRIWSFSGPYFPAFGLNKERYIPSECGKIRSRKTTNTHIFHAVYAYIYLMSVYHI